MDNNKDINNKPTTNTSQEVDAGFEKTSTLKPIPLNLEDGQIALQPKKQSRLANFGDKIHSWKPGQSGNPAGRPKKERSISMHLDDIAGEIDPKTGKLKARLLAEALFMNALKDPQFMREAMNRLEGKVTDDMNLLTSDVSILYELYSHRDDEPAIDKEK